MFDENPTQDLIIATSRPRKVLTPISLAKLAFDGAESVISNFRKDVNEFNPTPRIIHKTEPNYTFYLIHGNPKYDSPSLLDTISKKVPPLNLELALQQDKDSDYISAIAKKIVSNAIKSSEKRLKIIVSCDKLSQPESGASTADTAVSLSIRN